MTAITKRFKRYKWLMGLIGAMALLCFTITGWGEPLWNTLDPKDRSQTVTITNETFSKLADKLKPAVVNINTTRVMNEGPMAKGGPSPFGEKDPYRDFWEKFFGGEVPREYEAKSLGSGVIINKEGFILTNNHVVESAKEILVTLHNEKDYPARVIGRDAKTDLALIKIDAGENLPAAPLGDSDKLKVGEYVLAIGNPFGLSETVTAGIVSAKGRAIGAGPYDDFIQTDASINPGNSGGPLFNFWGEVIGINAAIIAAGQGIGFAIPINMAKDILPQLKEKGQVTRGWLGVGIQRLTPQLAKSFGIGEKEGVLVSQVFKDSPAEKAGIKQGDIILKFDGKTVAEVADLSRNVAATPVGKMVEIRIYRGKEAITLQTKVSEMEEKEVGTKTFQKKPLGLNVQNITPEIARSLRLDETTGVVVTRVEPGSPASKADIQRGDVIQEVNRESIEDVDDFARAMEKAQDQENILLLIRRGGNSLYVTISPK